MNESLSLSLFTLLQNRYGWAPWNYECFCKQFATSEQRYELYLLLRREYPEQTVTLEQIESIADSNLLAVPYTSCRDH